MFIVPVALAYLRLKALDIIIIWIVVLLFSITNFIFYFYRDPERKPPKDPNVIISPADGKIEYIKRIQKGEIPISVKGRNKIKLIELTKVDSFLNSDGYIIGIGMKLFDVHVNRSPIRGTIRLSKHNPGSFINMFEREFEILNESHTTIIEHDDGYNIAVVQIATFLVRCIQSFLQNGDQVLSGERIGKIKLGSQVDVIIPFINVKILVKEGERVYAGESILAEVLNANRG